MAMLNNQRVMSNTGVTMWTWYGSEHHDDLTCWSTPKRWGVHTQKSSVHPKMWQNKKPVKIGYPEKWMVKGFFFPPLTLVLSHVVSTAVTLDGSSRIRLLRAALLQLSQHLLVILAKAKKTAGNDWRYWYLTSGLGSSSYSTLSYFINLYWLQKSLIQ